MNEVLLQIAEKIEKGDAATTKTLTDQAVAEKIHAGDILNEGLVKGMLNIGAKFKRNEVFIPNVLIAARAMKGGMEIIKPLLAEAKVEAKGKVAIGTVKGDLHDIGKNIVMMMLEGAGYQVIDLGIDVPAEKVIDCIEKEQPDVIGLSALLTTTMVTIKDIINAMDGKNLRTKTKVIIGGAPVSQNFADEVKADGYAADAASAVDLVESLLKAA